MFHLNVSLPMRASLFITVFLLLMTTSITATPFARNRQRKRTSQEEDPQNFAPRRKVRCVSPDIMIDLTNDGNGPARSPNGCAARCRNFEPFDCRLMHFNLTTEECFTCNDSGVAAPLMDDDRIQSYVVYDDIDLCHKTCYPNKSCSLTESKLDFICSCPGGSAGDFCERRVFELTITRKLGLIGVGVLTGIIVCFVGALYSVASSRKKLRSTRVQIEQQGVLSHLWGGEKWFDSRSTAAVFKFQDNKDGTTSLIDLDEESFDVTQAFDSMVIHVTIGGETILTGTVEPSTKSIWWEAQEETWNLKTALDDHEDKLYKERSQPRRTVTRSEGSCVEGSVRMSEPGARSHSLAIAIRYPKYFLSQDSIPILETPGCPCPFRQKLKQDLEDAFPEDKGDTIAVQPCEILPSTKEYPYHKFIVVTFQAQFRQTLKGLYKNLKVQIKAMNGNLGSLTRAEAVSAILITTPHIKRSVIPAAFEIQRGYSSASSGISRASTSIEGRPNPASRSGNLRIVDESSTLDAQNQQRALIAARVYAEAFAARAAATTHGTSVCIHCKKRFSDRSSFDKHMARGKCYKRNSVLPQCVAYY